MNYIKQLNAFWNWRKFQADISHAESDLYFALLHCANGSGWKTRLALPNSTLIATANLSDASQLAKLRNKLVQKGLIEYIPGKKGKSPEYILMKLYNETPENNVNIGVNNTTNTQIDGIIDNYTDNYIDNYPDNYTDSHSDNIYKYKIKQNKNKTAKKESKKKEASYDEILSEFVNDERLREAYMEFIKMRRLSKKPMTNKALETLIRKVDSLEPESVKRKIELLENAVLHNWQSVYPLKDNDFTKERGERPDSAYCARNYEEDDLPF